ncbi:hypothetical protein Tco_1420524 [Tanacetum coccineum]
MFVLESCPKHNMVAYLEKTDGNAEFHEIIDFLARSSIHNALTVSPVVSTTFVEQFWMSAKSKIINNVRYITAKVAGKHVSISEASIRSDLLFDDADGIDSLPNQTIFDVIQLMGYEEDLTVLTFNKALFSPQWRFLFHTMNHCISSKSTSWDQIPTNIATAVICLTSNQKYNFSKLIFDGMLRHLDAKKKYVMYPRFISIFLDKQLMNAHVPLDHFPVNALTSKVFSFMVKKGKHFSGKVTPLFASMLVQPTEDEGATSERPSEPQPTPSPPHPKLCRCGNIHGGYRSSQGNKTLEGTDQEASEESQTCYYTLHSLDEECILEAKIGKKEILEEKLDAKGVYYMDTEDAQDVGRTRDVVNEEKEIADNKVSTEDALSIAKQNVSTDKPNVNTDRPKVNTDKEKDSTVSLDEGTDDRTEGRSATPTTPTMFGDDETIAQVLLNMSQAKVVSREKEKRVELKDVEETERPRPTSTRSLLTLNPLPKIDPKDKGKKKIEEEDESDTESEGIPEAEKKFKQLARDGEMARKIQEDWEAEEEVKKLAEEEAIKTALSNEYDFIQARIKADRLLALRPQHEEREQFTVEERAKFLHDTILAQRRFLAEQRAIAIRNRPPTRTQLRNQMMTYLKHVGNKKHSDLMNKTFEEIQALYEKVKRFDESFIVVGSTEDKRRIKEMNEGVKDPDQKSLKKRVVEETPKKEDTSKVHAKVDMTEQGTKKRKGGHMKMLARKRKRSQSDVDSDDEHRKCLKIVTFEGTMDSEIMERKSVIARLNKVISPDGDYLVIYRANGNFRAFNWYSEITLEGIELILWGDLKIMMESSPEENDQKLKDGTVIHMLVERRYPISKDLLQRMLDLGLEVERERELVFNSPCFMVKSWLVQDQTVLGKDYSNMLIADSLLKTIWFINAPCYGNEALASPKANELTIPEQTATGKGKSNPFMAGSLPKTTKPT